MARRLNSSQKQEILDGYRSGKTAIDLAKDYGCSPNTIIRTVKGMLPPDEYSALKGNRMKETPFNNEDNQIDNKDENFHKRDSLKSSILKEKIDQDIDNENSNIKYGLNYSDDCSLELDDDISQNDLDQIDLTKETNNGDFNEVIPLISSFGFESEEQKVAWKPLERGLLPEIVYMLIDKKIELESKPLSDFPEWSFLPDEEKSKQAICLFSNQRTAKRSCDRSQRVIKIPDSNVFVLSVPYLLAKGITRIILEDSLISLDSKEEDS